MRTGSPFRHRAVPILFFVILTAVTILVTLIAKQDSQADAPDEPVYLPLFNGGGESPLCRFGVNFASPSSEYDTSALRLGWYVDYSASAIPTQPKIPDYAPIISLSQIGADDYDYLPKGDDLNAAIDANPGVSWLIGNEPDRIAFQNDIEPQLYAQAYHELYLLIKARDPSARIFAGNIVQPTPIRLLYLDMVLDSYQTAYGSPMPVDGWGIHNFILNEVSCEYDDTNCWGAEVPPGVNVNFGEILSIQDNDNLDLFKERIERFRQWMVDRGYGGLPVYLSEYGVLMPEWLGFAPSRVNSYMSNTFSYLLNAKDDQLGDPNDGYRLVQRLSWYSDSDINFNGWLFDPALPGRPISSMGQNYADYVTLLEDEIDLYPVKLTTIPAIPDSAGTTVTVTLKTTIANQGNQTREEGPAIVRFYNADPNEGGNVIGEESEIWLSGCGDSTEIETVLANLPAGSYTVYVEVDNLNRIFETDETNNIKSFTFDVN